MTNKNRSQTPHERRINAMTTRDRLIFRLIRRIAILLGRGKEFDAQCDRIALMSEAELEEQTRKQLDQIRETYVK